MNPPSPPGAPSSGRAPRARSVGVGAGPGRGARNVATSLRTAPWSSAAVSGSMGAMARANQVELAGLVGAVAQPLEPSDRVG